MNDPLVAMQVGSISFVDEGVDSVLDIFKEKGAINALYLANFTYTRGTGGRQVSSRPLPDHGAREYDLDWVGGNYGPGRSEFYKKTLIRPGEAAAPEHLGFSLMDEITARAHEREMKVYCWMEESSYGPQARLIPNFHHCLEIDAWGRKSPRPCFNSPDYRNWHFALIEDVIKAYPVDGVAWCSERNGPLQSVLMSWGGGQNLTCFCDHCRAIGREHGIDVNRARTGMQKLGELTELQSRPTDGWFVSFWRLLLEYPEILAWERLWHEGQNQIFREMYGMIKAINPVVEFGWHIMHLNSFSPFYRATQNVAEFTRYADFIKLVAYNNCAGPRFVGYMNGLHKLFFADSTPDRTYRLVYDMLGIDEGDIAAIAKTGWSADYVRRETERALRAVQDAGASTAIYTGIDIDIPTQDGEKQTQPEDVYAAVTAALEAGAQGVVLSRKYSEMMTSNLAAAGDAVREWKRVNPA